MSFFEVGCRCIRPLGLEFTERAVFSIVGKNIRIYYDAKVPAKWGGLAQYLWFITQFI
jgi:capsule polysaccharide export protein KpsC/LpsZ